MGLDHLVGPDHLVEWKRVVRRDHLPENYVRNFIIYPWCQPDYLQRPHRFLTKYVCEDYLANVFNPVLRYVHTDCVNRQGYTFIQEDGTSFIVRSSCLNEEGGNWICKPGKADADYIKFFGFRNRTKPRLEFILDIPIGIYIDRNQITIRDDGFHLAGFEQLSVDKEDLMKARMLLDAINRHDINRIGELSPYL